MFFRGNLLLKKYTDLTPARYKFAIKLHGFKSHQVCENQTRFNMIFTDLLQVIETTCIKLVDKKV